MVQDAGVHRTWLPLCLSLTACGTTGPALVEAGREAPLSPAIQRHIPTDSGVEVLAEIGHFELSEDGRKTYTYTLRYRIRDAGGLQRWSRFQVAWVPSRHERPEMRAQVTDPSGRLLHLDPRIGSRERARRRDEARRPNPWPRRGLRSRAHGRLSGRGAALPSCDVREVCPRPRRTGAVVARRVRLPGEHAAPHSTARLLGRGPRVETRRAPDRGGDRRGSSRRVAGRALLSADVPRVPHVAFTTEVSWSRWSSHFADAYEAWIAEAGAAIAKASGDIPPPARVQDILRNVHEMVAWDGRPVEDAPRSPLVVLGTGRGNALEKALLVIAWARAAELPAEAALSKRGVSEDVAADFAEGAALDHALVYLPRDDLFIDVTDRFQRPGALPVADQGRQVLLVRRAAGELVRTPEQGAKENRYHEVRVLDLTEGPELTFFEETTAIGPIESRLRARFAEDNQTDLRRYLTDYLRTSYRGGRLDELELQGVEEIDEPLSIRIIGKGGGVVQTERDRTTVFIAAPVLFTWLPKPIRDASLAQRESDAEQRFAAGLLATREAEVAIPEPFSATVRLLVKVPTRWSSSRRRPTRRWPSDQGSTISRRGKRKMGCR
ncbi:MAG: DUF3857 domain-containing protein [Myxococcales bacterium]|nr:DUF3857 domain-containing protein [Myxococcales bacterium]